MQPSSAATRNRATTRPVDVGAHMAAALAPLEDGFQRIDPMGENLRDTAPKSTILGHHLLGKVVQRATMLAHSGWNPFIDILRGFKVRAEEVDETELR